MERKRIEKRISAWSKGFLWVGVGIGMGLFGCSGKEFERNPNLHLVVKHDNVYLVEPVWTTTGRILYLESDGIDHYAKPCRLYSVNCDGTDDRCLDPDGQYRSIDASRFGDTVVVVKWSTSMDSMLLIRSNGDRIKAIPIEAERFWDARFSWDETHIYFYMDTADTPGVYRVEIDSPYTVELVKDTQMLLGIVGFDVGYNDTLIIGDLARIDPADFNYVVLTGPPGGYCPGITLRNIQTGESAFLDSVATPYRYDYMAGFCYPNWSPDGQQIIFSVGPDGGVENGWMTPFEIWRLENAWELLPQK